MNYSRAVGLLGMCGSIHTHTPHFEMKAICIYILNLIHFLLESMFQTYKIKQLAWNKNSSFKTDQLSVY